MKCRFHAVLDGERHDRGVQPDPVANLDPWSELEPGEIESMVNACRFAEVDNVLFLLTPAPENYQAFTIENDSLVPLHQEHRAEFCSTCSEREDAVPSQEAF